MTKYGMLRVAAAVPATRVSDTAFNAEAIINLIDQAQRMQAEIIVFPELSITSYTCGDLFGQTALLDASEEALLRILHHSQQLSQVIIVGAPARCGNCLFNAAVVIQRRKILGIVPKFYLPNRNELRFSSGFDTQEKEITLCNQTAPFGTLLFKNIETGISFAIEIGDDLWAPIPPSSYHCLQDAQLIFNLSASNELAGKQKHRRNFVTCQSARTNSAYIYTSAGCGESTTNAVYGGSALIAENGNILVENERFFFDSQLIVSDIDVELLLHERRNNPVFSRKNPAPEPFANYQTAPFIRTIPPYPTLVRTYSPHPFIPEKEEISKRCEEIVAIQTTGLAKRLLHTQLQHAVIGVSGGLDSTLALLVTAKTFDNIGLPRKNIIGVTMPGLGTTKRTHKNALQLMEALEISMREINIIPAVKLHFNDIGHDPMQTDATYENAQARERTQILMDIANQVNGLVIGTGNLSELALGWATYNGDLMSMYAVNAGIPKTLVRHLIKWAIDKQSEEAVKGTLSDILNTPISPELLPATGDGIISQKTEELIGPYQLHDFFLYYMARFGFSPKKIFYLAQHAFADIYPAEMIRKWLKIFVSRFFAQQFKRSCLPDGPAIGTVNLSPRNAWNMPSDACVTEWMAKLEIDVKK